MNNSNRPYFLLSFLPALAYWYLESYYNLETALVGGILIGIIEMLIEKKISGHIHTLSKLNLILIVALGGISLIAKEGLFFKLQPTFTGLAISTYLVSKKLKNESLMIEMLNDFKQKPPMPEIFYKKMEWHLCIFLSIFALFMGWIAFMESTAVWLFWKTGGLYLAFGLFMVFEIIYLKRFMRSLKK